MKLKKDKNRIDNFRVKSSLEKLERIYDDSVAEGDYIKNGEMPEFIFRIVRSCSDELNIIKSEIGIHDKIYIDAAEKVVLFTTSNLTNWIHRSSDIIHVPISGLKLGNTLFQECIEVYKEIDKIETDEETKSIFKKIKNEFDSLNRSIQSSSNSSCYIATFVYGSTEHPDVVTLRNFRDEVLLKYTIGNYFVRLYYWISPKLILFFNDSEAFKRLSRIAVKLIIRTIRK